MTSEVIVNSTIPARATSKPANHLPSRLQPQENIRPMMTDSPSVWHSTHRRWPHLALWAFVMIATAGAARVNAQTVVMRVLAADATLEATLGQVTASGKAGPDGIARAVLNAVDAAPTAELVVVVYVDQCGTNWRAVLVERTIDVPPPNPGCVRREIPGAFVVRRITSLNIDVTGSAPTLLIRQGPPPESWLAGVKGSTVERFIPPAGLMVFGGGGIGRVKNVVSLFCGDVVDCSGDSWRPTFTGGVTFWLTPYIGAIGSYTAPLESTTTGSGARYRFNSEFATELLTVSGAVGVPVRRVRLFGHIGLNFHRGRFTTIQTTDPVTVTVEGEPFVLQGGTQTFDYETSGWGWIWGGGAEIWVTSPLAIYTELTFIGIKGDDRRGGEFAVNDTMRALVAGVRYRLGRSGR